MSRPSLRRFLGVTATAFGVVLVVTWVLLLRPQFLGGPAAYIIVSGKSMEPTLHDGDFVITHRKKSYEPGDVVAYRVPEGKLDERPVVIHRITGGSAASGFVTRGDNREGRDLWRPKPKDVVGEMWVGVPRVGVLLALVPTPLGMATFAGLAALLLVGAGPSRKRPRAPGIAG